MSNQWKHGLWDISSCLYCIAASDLGAILMASARNRADGMSFCKALCCRTACCNYTAVREAYNIEGSVCNDWWVMSSLPVCATARAYRETRYHKAADTEKLVEEEPRKTKKKRKSRA